MKKTVVKYLRFLLLFFCVFLLSGCDGKNQNFLSDTSEIAEKSGQSEERDALSKTEGKSDAGLSPDDFSGEPYRIIRQNQPDFTEKQKKSKEPFEKYSSLDSLGRCGVAFANICEDLMPTEKRGAIGMIRPSGWQTVKYDHVDGKYLYNRCHLIGYQLAGENANEKNLITGTRYMNVEGMLSFENEVAEYVKKTNHHVLYRVTPVFEGENLLASGVQMEAFSVEDRGKGICFNVFVFNVQPGVVIDYKTGKSSQKQQENETEKTSDYVINKNTGKFHLPSCDSIKDTLPKNRKKFHGDRKTLIGQGYSPCGRCNP